MTIGLAAPRPERCDHCPPGTPAQPCWWVCVEKPWVLCALHFEDLTGVAPSDPPAYLKERVS